MKIDTDNPYNELTRVFHEPSRLAIMSALCAAASGLSFNELKAACDLTDGNQSRHLKTLGDSRRVTQRMIAKLFGQAGVVIVEGRVDQCLQRGDLSLAAMPTLTFAVSGRLRFSLALPSPLAGLLMRFATNLQRLLPFVQHCQVFPERVSFRLQITDIRQFGPLLPSTFQFTGRLFELAFETPDRLLLAFSPVTGVPVPLAERFPLLPVFVGQGLGLF